METATESMRDGPSRPSADQQHATSGRPLRADSLPESLAVGTALVACTMARLPHRILDATGVAGWAAELFVVVTIVIGARALARALFTFGPAGNPRTWLKGEARAFVATVTLGFVLTLPLYALLRATPHWWLLAWALFAVVTVIGQVVTPVTLRADAGPLAPAEAPLAARVRAVGEQAGVEVKGDVLVAGGPGGDRPLRYNAYVLGLGPTRRVVLDHGIAGWPAELLDQVVAHEIGHWRLGHNVRRLPLALATQLATFALAAWVFSLSPVLDWAGVAHAGDPRSYALLLLLTPLLSLPARCVLAWRDRAQERAADEFALALLHTPHHFASMLERAADEGGAPRRLPWWRRLTASHPTISERAVACTRFASTA